MSKSFFLYIMNQLVTDHIIKIVLDFYAVFAKIMAFFKGYCFRKIDIGLK